MIELGDEVMDTVSGFKGVAVAITKWLNGCTRISVQPKVDKDGKLPESNCFDEPQLKVTKAVKRPEPDRRTGGPMPFKPTREKNPTR